MPRVRSSPIMRSGLTLDTGSTRRSRTCWGTCGGMWPRTGGTKTSPGSSPRSARGSGRRCWGRSRARSRGSARPPCGWWYPRAAEALLFRPLELAHTGGKPLAVQDVTLVMQTGSEDAEAGSAPVGDRLRVLGLFSLPEGRRSLNLRRERHSLVGLIRGIAAAGKAADVRVLQYGVTRERLRDVLEEAEGWDVIHVSGHGTPGELLLETSAGNPDRVSAADLADLLDPARERVKLVTVAACWSAAVTAVEQRCLLGLPVPDQRSKDDDPERSRHPADGGSASGAVATELASRLGCAVLAMRYPVGDEFAMALTGKLYDLLARQGQPLPRAIGITLRQLLTGTRYPALSATAAALSL